MITPAAGPQSLYRFADLTLDVARRAVTRSGKAIELKALDFDLLRFLVESAPNVVNADVLAEKVWGRHFVSPENVAQRVMLLRASLSDDANRPRYIETIRNKGYRLVPLVERVHADDPRSMPRRHRWLAAVAALLLVIGVVTATAHWPLPAADRAAGAARRAPPNSIAVLPFTNLSADPDQAYFADGLSQELLDKLTKIEPLLVTAYTSSSASAAHTGDVSWIARTLGVAYVLEGSVRRVGNQVRINAQLTDATTGFLVWSETYDGVLADVFALQEEIARQVADALQVTLGIGREEFRAGGTENMHAYEHYLLARSLLRQGRGQLDRARAELEQALTLDTGFGLAHVALAQIHVSLASGAWPPDAARLADARDRAIERAVAIAPDLPETSWLRAERYMLAHDWAAAERAAKEMWEQSSPNDFAANANYATFLRRTGRARESLQYEQRALLLDPLVAKPYVNLGFLYDALGDPARAAATYEEMRVNVASLVPNDVIPHLFRVLARGDVAAARRVYEDNWAILAGPEIPVDVRCHEAPLENGSPLLLLLCDSDRGLAKVREAYASAPAGHAFSFAAPGLFAAHFGDAEVAAESFGKALLLDPVWLQFAWIPTLEAARRQPTFKEVMTELKLVDYWRESQHWPERCRPLGERDFECF
jgi:TolB-like protein/DNA-binding winged helix-turn-helix (wHTH) protein/Tfp pilus assembly protein PilF